MDEKNLSPKELEVLRAFQAVSNEITRLKVENYDLRRSNEELQKENASLKAALGK